MIKQDLLNTKWDAREWSDEMKRKWEARVSGLGFFWLVGRVMVNTSDIDFYFLNADGHITLSDSGCADKFFEHSHIQCAYSLLFPKTTTDQGQNKTAAPTASDLLSQGAEILNQRGAEYEKDGNQERSFDSVATAFNAITGKDLTVAEVALMLQCVKDVRQWSQDRLHEDSVIDGINYAALKGELLHKQYEERKKRAELKGLGF